MLKRFKRDGKKGFTLVELIVVLVILAILAALLVPTLIGYIDKAREKQIVAETRQVVMAAQTLVDEAYGKGEQGDIIDADNDIDKADIAALAEVEETNIKEVTVDNDNKINKVVYSNGTTQCTYDIDAAELYDVGPATP
jgi:type IV pilus assembly protein PilA